jgi:hypothetical protein
MTENPKDDRTSDQPSAQTQHDEGALKHTVVKIVRGAAFVARMVRPVVSSLAKTYTQLGPLNIAVTSVEAGLKEAEKHINTKTGEKSEKQV